MRMMTGRPQMDKGGFQFNLDGGMSQGPKYIARPARDPIAQEPEDVQIKALLQRCLCRAKLATDCWEVTSVTGTVKTLSFSASYAQWKHTCENLLLESLLSPSEPAPPSSPPSP